MFECPECMAGRAEDGQWEDVAELSCHTFLTLMNHVLEE